MEVEGVGGDGGAGCLDLAPEVAGFVDEEAARVGEGSEDVLFEAEDGGGVAVRGVESGVGGETERFVLHGGTDEREDGGREKIDTAVD